MDKPKIMTNLTMQMQCENNQRDQNQKPNCEALPYTTKPNSTCQYHIYMN